MNKQDGQEILKVVQDFLNTEMLAGNRITKCNATYFANIMTQTINIIIAKYENQKKINEEIKETRQKDFNKQKNPIKKAARDIIENKMSVVPSEK